MLLKRHILIQVEKLFLGKYDGRLGFFTQLYMVNIFISITLSYRLNEYGYSCSIDAER